MTVAMAAPFTPTFSVQTSRTSRPMFSRLERIRKISGVVLSPSERRMPASRLYSISEPMPRKIQNR